MMEQYIEMFWAGFHWKLDVARTAFIVENSSLLIADFHLGKHTHFRKHGIALPAKAAQENIHRLQLQIAKYQPKEVIFMGDLFHSSPNSEIYALLQLMESYPTTAWKLIPGNHDYLQLAQLPKQLELLPEIYKLGALHLQHHPPEKGEASHYCYGHLHPAYRLRSKAKSSLRFPCFAKLGDALILPAFSSFAGGHLLSKSRQEDVFWLCTPAGIAKV